MTLSGQLDPLDVLAVALRDRLSALPPPPPRLLGVKEVARTLGVGERTVWDLIRHGELPSIRIGTRRVVAVDTLLAFVREREEGRR
jgi:excisionase family DNA binding protein